MLWRQTAREGGPRSSPGAGDDRSLVLGLGEGEAAGLAVPAERRAGLIAYGPPLSDDATARPGTAAQPCAPDPAAARAPLTDDRYARIKVHPWRLGGRPS